MFGNICTEPLSQSQRGVWEHGAIGALQGTQQSFQASSSILAEFTGSD